MDHEDIYSKNVESNGKVENMENEMQTGII